MSIQHAMLLAAGRGSRMRPLTDHTPKPLLKVLGKPLIQWHLERLATAGIQQVVINHAWLGQQIVDFVGNGQQFGLQVQYSAEEQPLETATGIKRALPLLGSSPFLVISTDIWTTWDAQSAHAIASQLAQSEHLAHLWVVNNPAHNTAGDFALKNGLLQLKNPHDSTYTYSGIGLFKAEFFNELSSHTPTPLLQPLVKAIQQQRVVGSYYAGSWSDIGTPQRLQQIEQNLASKA